MSFACPAVAVTTDFSKSTLSIFSESLEDLESLRLAESRESGVFCAGADSRESLALFASLDSVAVWLWVLWFAEVSLWALAESGDSTASDFEGKRTRLKGTRLKKAKLNDRAMRAAIAFLLLTPPHSLLTLLCYLYL